MTRWILKINHHSFAALYINKQYFISSYSIFYNNNNIILIGYYSSSLEILIFHSITFLLFFNKPSKNVKAQSFQHEFLHNILAREVEGSPRTTY